MRIFLSGSDPDSKGKVAGIGMVINILRRNGSINYELFKVGRVNGQRRGFKWFFNNIKKYFFSVNLIQEDYDLAHVNTNMNKSAIFRDYQVLKRLKKKKI